jgi:hypothetical protein
VLWFIFFFVVKSALEEAAGESLPGYGVGVNNGGVWVSRSSLEAFCWDASCLVFVF